MLQSESSSVCYEAANTLYYLFNTPSAVKASATTLLSLINSQVCLFDFPLFLMIILFPPF